MFVRCTGDAHTSGPMPSPGSTATFHVFACVASPRRSIGRSMDLIAGTWRERQGGETESGIETSS